MDDAHDEDGAAVVAEHEGTGSGSLRSEDLADTPGTVARAGDEQGDAAAGDVCVSGPGVGEMVPRTPQREQDIDREDDQGRADETLAHGLNAGWNGKMKRDDGDAEGGHRERVSESVEQAETHALAPAAPHTGDVRDSGEVVVVEAVAQAQQQAGDEREFKRRGHRRYRVSLRRTARLRNAVATQQRSG